MTTADIEREKALKARNTQQTPTSQYRGEVEEDPQPKFTPKTADEYKDIIRNPSDITPNVKSEMPEPITRKGTVEDLAKVSGVDLSEKPTTQTEGVAEDTSDYIGKREQTTQDTLDKINTIKEAQRKGKEAGKAIQNTEIPRMKRMTFKDIINNPEYEGIRGSLMANALGAGVGNALTRSNDYNSAMNQYNQEQAQRYSNAIADRDLRSAEAEMQAIEAGNKRDVGQTLQWADTEAGRAMDRYGLLYDTETKKQLLDQMVADSKSFAEKVSDPEDRMMLTAYQKYLSGDASMLDSLISTYGITAIDKLSDLVDWVMSGGKKEPKVDSPVITIGGTGYTNAQLNNLKKEGINEFVSRLPIDQQQAVLDELRTSWTPTFGDNTKEMDWLQKQYEGRKAYQEGSDEAQRRLAEESKAHEQERIKDLKDEISFAQGKKSYDDRIKAYNNIIDGYNTKVSRNEYIPSQTEEDLIEKVRGYIENEKIGKEAKTFDKFADSYVKDKNLSKYDKIDGKDVLNSLKYISNKDEDGNYWLSNFVDNSLVSEPDRAKRIEAVKNTQGYKRIKNYLSHDNMKSYVLNNPNYRYLYDTAVDAFLNVFGGERPDYGFLAKGK